MRKLKCMFGHKPGSWKPAPGGRDVKRCVRCDEVVEERSVVDDNVRRAVNNPPPAGRFGRPQGKVLDTWPKD